MIEIQEAIEGYLEQKAEYLLQNHEYIDYILHKSTGYFYDDFIRSIGYGIIVFLGWINDFIENIIHSIITFNDFYATGPVADLMDTVRPIVWSLFLIALVVLGFQFMLNKLEKRSEIILNILLALCVIVVLPDLMSNFGNITSEAIEEINSEKSSIAGTMMKSNIADVLYYAQTDFTFSAQQEGDENLPPYPTSNSDSSVGTTNFTNANRFSSKGLVAIPINEKLDIHETTFWFGNQKNEQLGSLSDDALKVLSFESIPTGIGSEMGLRSLDKNDVPGTKIGREAYYRYHVNWFVLIVSLAVTALAMIVTIIKIGRNVFDLAFQQIFAMFISATDLTGGQRTKKVISEIIATFSVIFIMILLLQLFLLYANWANGLMSDIGVVGTLLLLIAGAWALIDAPDVVQRVLGVDAGVRSGYQALVGGAVAAGAIGKGARSIGKTAGAIGKGGVGTASSVAGRAKGMLNGITGRNQNSPVNASALASKTDNTSGAGDGNPPNIPPSGGGEDDNPPNIPPNGGGVDDNSSNTALGRGGEDGKSRNIPLSGDGIPSNTPSSRRGRDNNPPNIPGSNSIVKENEQAGNNDGNKNKAARNESGKSNINEPIPNSTRVMGRQNIPIENSSPSLNEGIERPDAGNINEPIPSGYAQTSSGVILPTNTQGNRSDSTRNSSLPTENQGIYSNGDTLSRPPQPISDGGSRSLSSSNSDVGQSNVSNMSDSIPSGYSERSNGLILPKNVQGSRTGETRNPSPTIQNQSINSNGNTVNHPSQPSSAGGSGSSFSSNAGSGARVEQTQQPSKQQQKYASKTEGHREAQHYNTVMGNRKIVQEAKEKHIQGYNSGYNMGKSIRRTGGAIKRKGDKMKRAIDRNSIRKK